MEPGIVFAVVALVYLVCGVVVFLFGEHVTRKAGEPVDPATPLGVAMIVALWPVFLAVVAAEVARDRRNQK